MNLEEIIRIVDKEKSNEGKENNGSYWRKKINYCIDKWIERILIILKI